MTIYIFVKPLGFCGCAAQVHMFPLSFVIKDSLTEISVASRNTDQDADQDKTPTERLLFALDNDTLSAADLMVRLGLSHKPSFRKNYLNPALEQKLIEPRSLTSQTVKIRSTENVKAERLELSGNDIFRPAPAP